ncbi:MAG: nucleotidyltransferase [Thaumarchaeota archaeon]|nr:nucleotidyltransferase [Nitrososphaerota archaeon]
MELDRVAADITGDLKEVVFVGGYAAIKYGVERMTHDMDLALATPIAEAEFEKLGYGVFIEGGKRVVRTRHGIKIDIYTKDVSGIPVPQIFETAVTIRAAHSEVRIMCLEGLLLAKMRAGRPQDNDDIRRLCRLHGKEIRWELVEKMAKGLESTQLRGYVKALTFAGVSRGRRACSGC